MLVLSHANECVGVQAHSHVALALPRLGQLGADGINRHLQIARRGRAAPVGEKTGGCDTRHEVCVGQVLFRHRAADDRFHGRQSTIL